MAELGEHGCFIAMDETYSSVTPIWLGIEVFKERCMEGYYTFRWVGVGV